MPLGILTDALAGAGCAQPELAAIKRQQHTVRTLAWL